MTFEDIILKANIRHPVKTPVRAESKKQGINMFFILVRCFFIFLTCYDSLIVVLVFWIDLVKIKNGKEHERRKTCGKSAVIKHESSVDA